MPKIISTKIPTGTIQTFPSNTIPDGWLICNGTALSTTTYSRLFSVIGYTYGNPGGGNFNIPDFRGMFLRGAGTHGTYTSYAGGSIGAYVGEKTKKNGLNASAGTSSVSGSVGGSDGTHTHGDNGHTHAVGLNGDGYVVGGNIQLSGSGNTYAFANGGTVGRQSQGGSSWTGYASINSSGSGHGHSISLTAAAQAITVGTGDSETKPVSYSVNYIIKY